MGSSVSPTSQLVQTIFNLRELQQRDEAQRLARQQFGLSQEQFGLQKQVSGANIAATQESQVSQLAQLLQQTQHPEAMLEHVPELAQKTGYSEGLLKTLVQNVKPSVETTKAGVVSQGAAAAGPDLAQAAAYGSIAGQQPGQLSQDDLHKVLIGEAKQVYGSLPADKKAAFDQGVLQMNATGQHPGEAAVDIAMSHLPPQELKLAAQIGAQLAPGASQDAQLKLGWANYRLQSRQLADESAKWQSQITAGLQEAQMRAKPEQLSKINEILQTLVKHEQDGTQNASTFTPFGKTLHNATTNALLEQLRQAAPDIYGRIDPKTGKPIGGPIPLPDVPLENDAAARSVFQYFMKRNK